MVESITHGMEEAYDERGEGAEDIDALAEIQEAEDPRLSGFSVRLRAPILIEKLMIPDRVICQSTHQSRQATCASETKHRPSKEAEGF
jgi:hypothetical protein